MTFVAGDAGHLAEHNELALQGTLGYAEVAVAQGSIGSTTDLTNVTTTVTTGPGVRRILVTINTNFRSTTTASVTVTVYLREGSTTLAEASFKTSPTINEVMRQSWTAVLTPTAAAHTYKLSATSGTGTLESFADATRKASILVTDIGV